ncbi:MAG: DUF6465 family protein [Lachnospiraceae bacterium]|nr:DUF6465 family protein [Lachnospiraceae bacterium]
MEELKKDITKTTQAKAESKSVDSNSTKVKEVAPKKAAAVKKTPAKVTAKKETTKAVAKKPSVKKTAEKKASTKSTASKKNEIVKFEFNNKSYSQEDLLKSAKDVWQYDFGKKASELKDIELYVKPEEDKAYYVFNNDITGSFSI